MNTAEINVILLAAGLSSRMGKQNKLLLPIHGVPMIRHMAKLYLALGIGKLIVVTGHQQQQVEEALQGLPLHIVYNPEFDTGQKSSMRIAISQLSDSCATVLVALGDQPLMQTGDLDYLLKAFNNQPKSVLVPYYQGQRGNPVVLSKAAILSANAQGQPLGCRNLIEKFPETVAKLIVSNNHFTFDMDTPQDVIAIKALLTPQPEASL